MVTTLAPSDPASRPCIERHSSRDKQVFPASDNFFVFIISSTNRRNRSRSPPDGSDCRPNSGPCRSNTGELVSKPLVAEHKTNLRLPTPISPAGTSVSGPICRCNRHKTLAEFRLHSQTCPWGQSRSLLPPPIASVVKLFLKTCSKAKNFKIPRLTLG